MLPLPCYSVKISNIVSGNTGPILQEAGWKCLIKHYAEYSLSVSCVQPITMTPIITLVGTLQVTQHCTAVYFISVIRLRKNLKLETGGVVFYEKENTIYTFITKTVYLSQNNNN